MAKVPYLDFQAIKLMYSTEEIMTMTGLPFKKDGKSYRCECPVHKGGDRTLVVTPGKPDEKGDNGVFYCFGNKTGGDRVALLAHVRDSKPYAVFKELAESRPVQQEAPTAPVTVPEETPRTEEKTTSEGRRAFQPLPYLKADHPAVTALGFTPEIANAAGLGWAPRGFHRNGVAVPIRTESGRLMGYISISEDGVKLPPKWTL